jgi:myosin heavy subunit
MLIPSSSWTLDIRDRADKILTEALGASNCKDPDKYQLGLTTIFFHTGVLAFLENLRTNRLNDCAIIIQKNLKAKYYRRKYLEAQSAILLTQSVARGYFARKYARETCKIRRSFNAIYNNITRLQAAAKGFLQRRQIMDMMRASRLRSSDRKSLDAVGPADGGSNKFTLSEDFRSKLQRIKTMGLENAHAFFYTIRHLSVGLQGSCISILDP